MERKDLRVVKTEQNIRGSFLRLLNTKSFSAITVQNILDEALINRTTFYRHYNSKYDLVNTLNKEIMERFEHLLSSSLRNRHHPDVLFYSIERLAEEFYANRGLVLALWRVQEDGIHLYSDMERLMRRKFKGFLEADATEEDTIEFQTAIMTALILTTFRYLLESEEKHTVRSLTEQVYRLMKKHLLQI